MDYQRAAILYNPAAGGGFQHAVRKVGEAADALRRRIPEVELFPTTPERRADVLAREAVAAGFDVIAPCGGDGTINEVINGIVGSDAVLLPLPAGTANVLAWETGMPVDPVRAAEAAGDAVACEVELGVVEFPEEDRRRFFLLMAGAGVDAGAVYRLNLGMKKKVGIVAYFYSGLQQLFQPFRRLHATVDGEQLAGTLLVASKSRLYGGKLVLTPHAHLLADEFDVVCFRSASPLTYTGYMAGVLTKTIKSFTGVKWRQAREIELAPSEDPNVYVQVDGELAGRLPVNVRMVSERIRILLPRDYCKNYPGRIVAGSGVPAHG